MASLAQMERELILERTRAGLEAAWVQGRVGGRKRRMTDGKVQAARKLLVTGTTPREVAHNLGVVGPPVISSKNGPIRGDRLGLHHPLDGSNLIAPTQNRALELFRASDR
jgi:DNA invertase Pin-like site-specific DNA recombinase